MVYPGLCQSFLQARQSHSSLWLSNVSLFLLKLCYIALHSMVTHRPLWAHSKIKRTLDTIVCFTSLQRGFRLATFTISEILIGDLSEIKGIRASKKYGYFVKMKRIEDFVPPIP